MVPARGIKINLTYYRKRAVTLSLCGIDHQISLCMIIIRICGPHREYFRTTHRWTRNEEIWVFGRNIIGIRSSRFTTINYHSHELATSPQSLFHLPLIPKTDCQRRKVILPFGFRFSMSFIYKFDLVQDIWTTLI